MKVVQILPFLETEAAGPSYSARRLAESLKELGASSDIWTVGATGPDYPILNRFPHAFRGLPLARTLRVSPGLRSALAKEAAKGTVLHSHGVWLLPNLYTDWEAARVGAPHVISPRGMLAAEALKFSQGRKRIVWALAQDRALKRASCLHATSKQEASELRALGLTNPIAIIPNGIDVPLVSLEPHSETRRTVLALGRIHPKKGLDRLINAWADVEADFPNWRLRLVGPSEVGYAEELSRYAAVLGVQRLSIDHPLFGDDKLTAYLQAGLFVLPTLNENFGLVVAEALAAGTPVICTMGAPWAGLESQRCGWWINHGAAPLEATLRAAMSLTDAERTTMGLRGRDWMFRDFAWRTVAQQMWELYDWVKGNAQMPDFVETL